MTSSTSTLIEDLTIQPVPEQRRTGRARHLFSVWFGVQIMPLTLVTGVLGPTVYGLDLPSTIVAILVGNAIGAVFMALHSVQGARLGVPQMIQARAQFGMHGSLLVLIVVVLMYLGFLASIIVLARDTLVQVIPVLDPTVALFVCVALTLIAVIFGYELIHRANRVLLYFFGAAVVLLAVCTIVSLASGHAPTNSSSFTLVGFIGMSSLAATWQIAYAPYVSDYSRYLPSDTKPKLAFWYTYLGAVGGAVPMMILGALLIYAVGGDGSMEALASVMPPPISLFVMIMLFLGAIDAAVMNLYGPSLCTLTLIQTFRLKWRPGATARNVVATVTAVVTLLIALFFANDFLASYSNFIHFLMCLLIPWSVVNLVDYYAINHGNYDVESFENSTKGYGAFNIPALLTYVIGFVVQLPFMSGAFFTGFIAASMNGIDISWLVGSIASYFLYLALARGARQQREVKDDAIRESPAIPR
ncbi:purine-cytosine permease family protein [Paenarthrobacter ureafaciens]|uniref:purine-cytosine permease family protein n=1 Tax=Paenarthrobacter ureafaciens TaxID=37931 RepID=UPI002DBE3853|nr:cytosine permease [Paenarthrobacter ureafaciens]MEC3854193.1 cytosine permease [Paenarthrobacter ureafaciens]